MSTETTLPAPPKRKREPIPDQVVRARTARLAEIEAEKRRQSDCQLSEDRDTLRAMRAALIAASPEGATLPPDLTDVDPNEWMVRALHDRESLLAEACALEASIRARTQPAAPIREYQVVPKPSRDGAELVLPPRALDLLWVLHDQGEALFGSSGIPEATVYGDFGLVT